MRGIESRTEWDRARTARGVGLAMAVVLAASSSAAPAQDCDGDGIPDAEALAPRPSLEGRGEGVEIAVGGEPVDFAIGDLNSDGALDLVAIFFGRIDTSLAIVLGRGDGSFERVRQLPLGSEERPPMELVDWDGDGALDLLTSSGYALRRGDGAGGFFDVQVQGGGGSGPFVTVDVDSDGDLDIVALSGNSLYLNFANPFGIVVHESSWPLEGESPVDLHAADLDGDGRADFVTSNSSSRDFSALLGRGDGTFAPERRLPAGGEPARFALEDISGDGIADLVAAMRNSPGLAVYLGTGDGGLTPAGGIPSSQSGEVFDLASADLDGDGQKDVAAILVGAPGVVAVHLARGGGAWQAERAFPVGGSPYRLRLADANRDGILDILTANRSSASLSLLLGEGGGEFLVRQLNRVEFAASGYSVAIADLDRDGLGDVVVTNGGNGVSVLLAAADGSLGPERRFPAESANSRASLALADLDGDGIPDAVTAGFRSSIVSVLLGDGDGGLLAASRYGTGAGPRAVAAGDLDGDGILDVVTLNASSQDLSILLGTGAGQLAAERRVRPSSTPSTGVLALGDIDGDGASDIITFLHDLGVCALLAGPDRSFALERCALESRVSGVSSLVAGDLDADGRLDVVAAASAFGRVLVLRGEGGGTLGLTDGFPSGLPPFTDFFQHTLGDFDGDGILDVVCAGDPWREVSVLLGRGDGSLRRPELFDARARPWAMAAGDIDGDGRLDIAVTDPSTSSVSVLLNRPVTLAEDCNRNSVPDACDVESGASADCDADGTPDECQTALLDIEPPSIQCLGAISVECASEEGAAVGFEILVEDACDPHPRFECTPAPGSVFPVGTTVVLCAATDASGNRSECRFEVRVSCEGRQVPGDANQDGAVDLSDAVWVFRRLFVAVEAAPCGGGLTDPPSFALLDWNGDGRLDISDGIAPLQYLFARGREHVLGTRCLRIRGCSDRCAI